MDSDLIDEDEGWRPAHMMTTSETWKAIGILLLIMYAWVFVVMGVMGWIEALKILLKTG